MFRAKINSQTSQCYGIKLCASGGIYIAEVSVRCVTKSRCGKNAQELGSVQTVQNYHG